MSASFRIKARRVARMVMLLVVCLSAVASPLPARAAGECFVDADAAGLNNGTSWTNAFTNLLSALGPYSCGVVWVAEGVYKPGISTTDTLQIIPGKQVLGGFDGTETSADQRDPKKNVTILSGDIEGNDLNTDGNYIAESWTDIVGVNSYHVVLMDGTSVTFGEITSSTVLSGFTITGGEAVGAFVTQDDGGGLYCNGSGPGNECSPTLSMLTFSGNTAVNEGGAMYNNGNGGLSSPSLTDVTFHGNSAASGGAMFNDGTSGESSPILNRVTFSNNSATSYDGGAMMNMVYPTGTTSPGVYEATFSGNTAVGTGGALASYGTFGTSIPFLLDVTFSGNQANDGGAVYVLGGSPLFLNVILWGNSAITNPQMGGAGVGGSGPTINNSVVQGGCASIPTATCGSGNLTTDPKLGNLADNSGFTKTMALMAGSSAIDTASGCSLVDQRNVSRPRGAWCDIGAYEKIPFVPSDFDGDTITDPVKFESNGTAWWRTSSDATWHGAYLGPGAYVRRSDFDGDGKADPAKFDSGNSLWYVRSSDDGFIGQYIGPGTYAFVAGSDYEGDGKTDPAQFNTMVNSLWYFSSNDAAWHGAYLGPGTYQYVTGSDFDGDGMSDPAHFNYSTNVLWYRQSSDMTWYGEYLGPGTYQYVEACDFDGDGMTDPAQFTSSSNTLWYVPSGGGGPTGVWLGATPLSYVPAVDFDGDGMTDPAGFDAAADLIWYLSSMGRGWQTIEMGAGTYEIGN